MYNFMNSKLPVSFDGMFIALPEPNRTKSVKLELIRNKQLHNFPKVFLSKTWNKLPIQFKESTSTNSLKSKLNRNMFLEYREFRCNKHKCYSCTQVENGFLKWHIILKYQTSVFYCFKTVKSYIKNCILNNNITKKF